ncbi:MAG TPA: aminoacyl-tRNA hydrolase [Sorangium sp.]|nr:aminoacyl-tRNA hydrolase [Sorangium sp.]
MWLVVGLGNPGAQYAHHRHNVGFMAIDELARREDCAPFRSKFSAQLSRCRLSKGGDDALLLKPQTFMNLSGDSVQPCAAFFKVPSERIIVVHDDLDLPFGEVRLKKGGGHGGHNGLRSLMQRLGGGDFIRIRCGIGRPPATFRGPVADFVLSNYNSDERSKLSECLSTVAKTVLDIAARGLPAAMKSRNTRTKKKRPKPPPQHADVSKVEKKGASSLLALATRRGQRPGGEDQ